MSSDVNQTKRVVLTVGVSASGKTTWARSFVAEMARSGETWENLSRDDFRLAILASRGTLPADIPSALRCWNYDRSGPDERLVDDIYADRLSEAFSNPDITGVVCSDTNLSDRGAFLLQKLSLLDVTPEFAVFRIPLETAVERDAAREFSVGASVISDQILKMAEWEMEAPAWALSPSWEISTDRTKTFKF